VVAWRKTAGRIKRRLLRQPVAAQKQGATKKASAKKATAKKPEVPPVHPIVQQVRQQKLTYLSTSALNDLYEAAEAAEREDRQGVILEAGCALGGSAIVLAQAKDPGRVLNIYDVFGMIPPPTDLDGQDVHERYAKIKSGEARGLGGEAYYGYETDLMDKVVDTFATFDLPVEKNAVTLVKGLFQDTITGDEPVALAHIDGDWYESVRTCLERIGPRLPSGGVMVIDDYFHWSGCRTAVDEFLAANPDDYVTVKRTRLHIVKVGPQSGTE
jgi:asparagine synthase (glutamine-hydrolysing)